MEPKNTKPKFKVGDLFSYNHKKTKLCIQLGVITSVKKRSNGIFYYKYKVLKGNSGAFFKGNSGAFFEAFYSTSDMERSSIIIKYSNAARILFGDT